MSGKSGLDRISMFNYACKDIQKKPISVQQLCCVKDTILNLIFNLID